MTLVEPRPEAEPPTSRVHGRALLWAVGLGALVRLVYLVVFPSVIPGNIPAGDGLAYHAEALRLADGLGYTAALGDVGGQIAHHPPGWVTVLGGLSWLGVRSVTAHQVSTMLLGLALIGIAFHLTRRLVDERAAVYAAFITAVYPGFWVLEAQLLSEPLALVTLGTGLIALDHLHQRPTVRGAALVGLALGLAALVRSEQIVVVVIAVPYIAWRSQDVDRRTRLAMPVAAVAMTLLLLAPWAIFNSTRFAAPVYLSSNSGTTLLAGNCSTFRGAWIGFYDTGCTRRLVASIPDADRSEIDRAARAEAIDNIGDHLSDLPLTVPARHGRMLAVLHPSQTVGAVATWHGTSVWPVWAWVVSFWALVPLAVIGLRRALRDRARIVPLMIPIVVVIGVVSVFYGEPRYHTPADLSIVVLAAGGLVALVDRRGRRDA